jgi:hypothetical protein
MILRGGISPCHEPRHRLAALGDLDGLAGCRDLVDELQAFRLELAGLDLAHEGSLYVTMGM